MHILPASTGIREKRLISYESYTGRMWDMRKDYFPEGEKRDAVDNTLRSVALTSHFFFSTIQSLFQDAARKIERNKDPVPALKANSIAPRMREDVVEGWNDLKKKHFGSAAIKAFNLLGDFIPDGIDFVAGVKHGRAGALQAETREKVAEVFKNEPDIFQPANPDATLEKASSPKVQKPRKIHAPDTDYVLAP